MGLPNADGAQVDPKKLKEYLLSETHPAGRSKAKFFHGMGFDESNFDVEFVTAEGKTVAVLTLTEGDLRLMRSGEILHARELASA